MTIANAGNPAQYCDGRVVEAAKAWGRMTTSPW